MKTLLAALALAALALPAAAQQVESLPGTTWLTEGGEAKVTFFQCGDGDQQLCGTLDWLQRQEEAGEPILDTENPDPELRSRELQGITMLWGFEQEEDGAWRGGRLYKPDEGKTFRGNIYRENADKLKLEGCIAPLLCRKQTWTKIP